MSLKTNLNCQFEFQYARSKHWFLIDIKWLHLNFSKIEPYFCKHLFQNEIPGQKNKGYYTFTVPVSSSKNPINENSNERDPVLKYQQHGQSTCIFGSLTYYLVVSCEIIAEHAISSRIEESLNLIET